jgi:hypothetical protein
MLLLSLVLVFCMIIKRIPLGGGRHETDVRIARIRLSDKSSRLRPRHVVPKPAQTYEPEVPVCQVGLITAT